MDYHDPAILIIVLLLCKVNAISALGLSSFAAGFVSYFVQHDTLQGIIRTAYNGYTTTIEEPVLQSILNRGGMGSMLQYVAIICFAVGMGGMLEKLGVLDHILQAIVKRINSDGSMILATMIVGYVTSLISCSQPMAHVLTGRLMAPVFQERKVAPEILSRCLEDSGTMAWSYDSMAWLRRIHGRHTWCCMVGIFPVLIPALPDPGFQYFLWIYRNFH